MVNPKQPKALYLADVLSAGFECDMEWYEIESARELRRLHAANLDCMAWYEVAKSQRDELLEALKYCRAVFPQDRWADDTRKMIDAAIARAEGAE